MSIGYNDIWVGGGVDHGWVGTVLPKVLLRWMPSRLSPLVIAAVSADAAAAADDDDDDDGGGGGDDDDDDDDSGDDDDDDDNDNDDNYDDDDDQNLVLRAKGLERRADKPPLKTSGAWPRCSRPAVWMMRHHPQRSRAAYAQISFHSS